MILPQPDDPKSILAPLREHGVTQLYQDAADNIKELKKLNSSFLVNFLDMLDILIKCPSRWANSAPSQSYYLKFRSFAKLLSQFNYRWLTTSSSLRTKKLDDLELLFCNFHHLINKFRPHQALETLIQMVKIQKDQKIHLIEQINRLLSNKNVTF